MAKILYQGYCVTGTAVYGVLRFLLPLLRRLGGRYIYGLEQRLGLYETQAQTSNHKRIWIHASSVGEVQAALVLINQLRKELDDLTLVVTTTTEQGNTFARRQLPADVSCYMAPLDLLPAVTQALAALAPDLYVCLETELWPVLLHSLRSKRIRACLVNARLSERSHGRYQVIKGLMSDILCAFDRVVAITAGDADRLVDLGVEPEKVSVSGNIKTAVMTKEPAITHKKYQALLAGTGKQLFVCGSTHQGEEPLLYKVFQRLASEHDFLWVVAPRHLKRVPEITRWLAREKLPFDRLSQLHGGKKRITSIVLVDTMGELADLYSVARFSFCGGSLVPKGGHNIMEIVRWGHPVYFGPYMDDFQRDAKRLCAAGCGFQADDEEKLTALLLHHINNPDVYDRACACTKGILAQGDTIVTRQAAVIKELIATV